MSIEELEKLRRKALKELRKSAVISILIIVNFIALFAFCIIAPNIPVKQIVLLFFMGLAFIIVLNALWVKNDRIKEFILAFKKEFVLKSLNRIFNNLFYNPDEGISEITLKDTGIIDTKDRFSSNDYISGKYKNINFSQSDIEIEEKHEYTDRSGGRHTVYESIFKGRWIIYDFNKLFKSNMVLLGRGVYKKLLNAREYEKILTEDQKFNQEFTIFCEDVHEAFYILTPPFMEKIKMINKNINGNIIFCFHANKLHIGINHYKDSFEPKIHEEINEEKIMISVNRDIKLITDFIDGLDLDNDLFKSEV